MKKLIMGMMLMGSLSIYAKTVKVTCSGENEKESLQFSTPPKYDAYIELENVSEGLCLGLLCLDDQGPTYLINTYPPIPSKATTTFYARTKGRGFMLIVPKLRTLERMDIGSDFEASYHFIYEENPYDLDPAWVLERSLKCVVQ
ncbi:MAG: hypothetical protein QE271_03235 [Bacteriovoracaceae bacterium]|nr:hypothetical protein [Bacteriovoracaceae bacterium]